MLSASWRRPRNLNFLRLATNAQSLEEAWEPLQCCRATSSKASAVTTSCWRTRVDTLPRYPRLPPLLESAHSRQKPLCPKMACKPKRRRDNQSSPIVFEAPRQSASSSNVPEVTSGEAWEPRTSAVTLLSAYPSSPTVSEATLPFACSSSLMVGGTPCQRAPS